MREAIEAKLNELFGARCPEVDGFCKLCQVWKMYDDLMKEIEEAEAA